MAHPYVSNSEDSAESGAVSTTVWNGTNVDTDSKLNVRHYEWVAKHGLMKQAPWQGAYCYHIDLSLGTADAYLESTNWATAAGSTIYTLFYIYVASNLTMATNDRFTLLALQSAGPVAEACIGIRNSAGVLQFWAGETTSTSTIRTTSLITNQWHALQIGVGVDAGVGNDGTLAFFVDGKQVGATITGLDQGEITQARWGAMDIDAGTTAGHLLLDFIRADDARLPDNMPQWASVSEVSLSRHVRLGTGQLSNVTLLDSGTNDAVLELFDTDTADTTRPRITRKMQYNDSVRIDPDDHDDGHFLRGCYARLSGTNALAFLTFREANQSLASVQWAAAQRSAA